MNDIELFSSSSEDDDENIPQRQFRPRINFHMMDNAFQFNEKFRMSAERFELLLNDLGPEITRQNKNHALLEHQILKIALHWLGTGAQYHAVADMHGVAKSTVCKSIHLVVHAVNTVLLNRYVCWPQENVHNIIRQFHQLAGMPLVVGAVDGSLFNIDAPSVNEPEYVDRYGNHSINAMFVCGPSMKFYYVNANWPGSVHDARVLRNSELYRRFEGGWQVVPNGILLGDSAYPLKRWLIPPVIRNRNARELRFLRAHKRTRRIIECALGIMKEKFPCLNYMRVNPHFACEIIKCCTALSNISRDIVEVMNNIEDDDDEDFINDEDEEEIDINNVQGIDRLEELLEHFN